MDNLSSYQSETDDSDTDEQICRSPQKSPRKMSSVLKRKRRHSLSDAGGSSNSLAEEDEEEQTEEQILESAKTSRQTTDQNFTFKEPQLRKRQFTFHPLSLLGGEEVCGAASEVTVTIPEQLAASYGLYLWPSAPVLAWYVWLHQSNFTAQTVLELGAGTALPGLLLAKVSHTGSLGQLMRTFLTDRQQRDTLGFRNSSKLCQQLQGGRQTQQLGVSSVRHPPQLGPRHHSTAQAEKQVKLGHRLRPIL